ncbi:MAG: hypothetical protein ACJ77A_03020 [Actinomycetota bacterium]
MPGRQGRWTWPDLRVGILGLLRWWSAKAVRRLIPVLIGVSVLVSSCVGPVRDFRGYQAKAWHSVETTSSAVETTILAIRDVLANDAFAPYLSVTIRDAEDDASSAQSQFDSIQPPDASSDRLRTTVSAILSDASETVSRARIAIRRGDAGALAGLRRPLGRLSKKLDDLSTRLRP